MNKTLYSWSVRCTDQCKNVNGVTEIVFVSESDSKPEVSCGPCGSVIMNNIALIKSETITESV